MPLRGSQLKEYEQITKNTREKRLLLRPDLSRPRGKRFTDNGSKENS